MSLNTHPCPDCNGKKTLIGTGMIEKQCHSCSGVGYVVEAAKDRQQEKGRIKDKDNNKNKNENNVNDNDLDEMDINKIEDLDPLTNIDDDLDNDDLSDDVDLPQDIKKRGRKKKLDSDNRSNAQESNPLY